MKKFSILFLLAIILLVFSQFSCNGPTAPNNNLSLTAADVVCTQVWLKLDYSDNPNGGDFVITRDGNTVLSCNLSKPDTILVDTTVLPSKSYTYIAYRMQNGKTVEQSSPLHITTLDSTSSSFSWQLYKFGDFNTTGMPSMLHSVAVINDSDVWATGEIYTGTGDSIKTYNSINWDGKSWNLKAIPLIGSCSGGVLYPPLKAVCKFSNKDILVSDGGTEIKYDGKTATADCRMNVLLSGAINAMFSPNPSNIYVIGSVGTIIYYNSQSWRKIASGTSMNLYDIYSTKGKDVYVAGGDLNNNGILLKGNANGFETIAQGNSNQSSAPHFDGIGKTVWVSNTGTVFFGGNLLYRLTDGKLNFVKSLPGNYLYGNTNGQYFGFLSQIRGLAENQIILVGQRNTLKYFNGMRWTQIGMPYDPKSGYTWVSVGMTNDIIIAVGYGTGNGIVNGGIIIMLKRQ